MSLTVAISILTYNHAKFIAKSIEGILAQKTNYSYKIFISDDNSKDNTFDICMSYIRENQDKIVVNSNKRNLGAIRNWISNFQRCVDSEAKYIAVCDGDDYWIDPYKLQKQIDFLEQNEDYGMIYSDIEFVDESGKSVAPISLYSELKTKYESGQVFGNLWRYCFINTNTTLFRTSTIKELFIENQEQLLKKWFIYDYWLWLQIAKRTKIKFLNEKTSAYRIHENGISRNDLFYYHRSYLVKLDLISSFSGQEKTKEIKQLFSNSLLRMLFSKRLNLRTKLQVFLLLFSNPPTLSLINKYKFHNE